jgi:DNA-binding response OmpR family regulator
MTANRAAPATPPHIVRKGDPSLSILVVDDESDLREMLTRSFSREGHRVMAVADGRGAIDRASTEHFDIILLDVALGPGPDGYEVCRTLRARRNVVPIIMLTALDSEADAVLGLEAGADDYVTKPFGMDELLARLRAALRRIRPVEEVPVVSTPDFSVDLAAKRVTKASGEVRLTPTEWHMLEILVRQPGRLVSQAQLLKEVWGPSYQDEKHYLRIFLSQLRRKLEPDPSHPRYFITEPGMGYRFEPETPEG